MLIAAAGLSMTACDHGVSRFTAGDEDIELSGRVTDQVTGEEVEGAKVSIASESGTEPLRTTETAPDGTFELVASPAALGLPDEVHVTVARDGYISFASTERTATLQQPIQFDVALEVAVEASGQVTDLDEGAPLEGARVVGLNGERELFETETDADGRYDARYGIGAEPQGITIRASADGHATVRESLSFDREIAQDLSLKRATFPGGSGTEADPYKVARAQDLQDITFFRDDHFVQVSDIDASGTASWNDGRGFEPIGTLDTSDEALEPFTGTYDGNGRTIASLTIDRPNEQGVGLFALVAAGQVRNITLRDADITGGDEVGGVAGRSADEALIQDAHVTGAFTGGDWVGGAVGVQLSDAEVRGSHADATVTGTEGSTGGLVGWNGGGIVHTSEAEGTVEGELAVGGLVGSNRSGGQIYASQTSASATGEGFVGGLVGQNIDASVEAAYATGGVTGEGRVGGLIGDLRESAVHETYATGAVTGESAVGGLIGAVRDPDVLTGYWDLVTTGQAAEQEPFGDPDTVRGLSTGDMQGASAKESMDGLDFVDTWHVRPGDYPVLWWEE